MTRTLLSIDTKAILFFLAMLVFFGACTSKKLSSNFGDDKVYKGTDDDTNHVMHVKEKHSKMPFDTTVAPVKRVEKHYLYDTQ